MAASGTSGALADRQTVLSRIVERAEDIAQRTADAMWADDRASRALGIEITEIGAGRCAMKMAVREDMLNGLDVCHGGLIFTLADAAMAYASNSHNVQAFAVTADMTWLRPARGGDVLTAVAVESEMVGRTGVYDVRVTRQDGQVVGLFRGRTRSVGRPVVSDDE